jgi:hypothetical protein
VAQELDAVDEEPHREFIDALNPGDTAPNAPG